MASLRQLNSLILLFTLHCNAFGHRCYNCGFDEAQMCDNFDRNNSTFIADCAAGKGCSFQTSDGSVTRRSCANVRLEDCKTANEVTYCFCIGELCNERGGGARADDDEDDSPDGEGSGGEEPRGAGADATPPPKNQSDTLQRLAFGHFVFIALILHQ